MEHLTVQANGAALHVARTGAGRPLLLLHGWPEFWLTWEPVMTRLADRFTLYAPDLRGFGDSDKPEGPFGPDQQAADMLALMDALGLAQAGIVGHDVGGALMQPLARQAPDAHRRTVLLRFRLSRHRAADGGAGAPQQHLVSILSPDGDGACARRREPRKLPALYRPFPESLGRIASTPSTIVLEAFTDNFLKAGNLAGGFAHYRAAHAGRVRMMKGEAPAHCRRSTCRPAFAGPSTIRFFPMNGPTGSARPLQISISRCSGMSATFPHREDPDRAATEIAAFFTRIGWS